jgi:hypothetical protein
LKPGRRSSSKIEHGCRRQAERARELRGGEETLAQVEGAHAGTPKDAGMAAGHYNALIHYPVGTTPSVKVRTLVGSPDVNAPIVVVEDDREDWIVMDWTSSSGTFGGEPYTFEVWVKRQVG